MTKALSSIASVVQRLIGALLLYSALIKIMRPYEFLTSVFQYQFVGPRTGTFVAGVLPFMELTVGIALVCGVYTVGASFFATALFLVFTIGQAAALVRGIDADCGCFGAGEKVGWPSLVRTASLFLGASICLLFTTTAAARRPRGGGDGGAAAGAGPGPVAC